MCIQLRLLVALGVLLLGGAGWWAASSEKGPTKRVSAARPMLPFPDNADSRQCGIPTPLGAAYEGELTGMYDGQLFEPEVRLYDSHARMRVVARIKAGSRVRGVLLVTGPQLNYLLVEARVGGRPLEGWVPQPYFRRGAP